MKKVLAALFVAACCFSFVFGSGKEDKSLATVRVGIHANEGGASLAAIAKEQGLFAKHGINPVFTIVESGPIEMTAMRADRRTLDIGYIGAGVAWNPIDGAGNSISFVFLDTLSNAEMLLAKKGIFADGNGNKKYDNDEIYAGLRGKTVYIEVGTTPGSWFKNLVDLVNSGKADADKLWISCETSSYLSGYIAPNSKPENKVVVVNTLNSNLPAGMAAGGGMEVVAGFAPATSLIKRDNQSVEIVATTSGNFPPEKIFPNTWVASDKWLSENSEVAQKFIMALYEAAVWRSGNVDAAMRAAEKLSQKPANSFDPMYQVFPTQAEYAAWFSDKSALGYKYMESLYLAKVGNVPKGNPVKPLILAFKDKYLLNVVKPQK